MDVEMPASNQGTAKRPRDSTEDATANTAPSKRLTKIHISSGAHDTTKAASHGSQLSAPSVRLHDFLCIFRADLCDF
jgi:hypothetical protein